MSAIVVLLIGRLSKSKFISSSETDNISRGLAYEK